MIHIGPTTANVHGAAPADLLVMEPMPVHSAAVLSRGNFRQAHDSIIPFFSKITDACHKEGAVIPQQRYHVGQHGDTDDVFHVHWPLAGMPGYHDVDDSHSMTKAEIAETIEGLAQAVRGCQPCGLDGVKVSAAYHGTINQLWAHRTNHRDDRRGGSLPNRARVSPLLATTNRAEESLVHELSDSAFPVHSTGDCSAPPLVPFAFYDSRGRGTMI